MLSANSDLGRRLRAPGYFIATSALVIQLIDLSFRGWPPRIHSAAWRLTFMGAMADVVMISLLFFFLLAAIAILARDRLVLYTLAGLTAVGAVGLLVASGVFGLDIVQMRDQVRVDRSQQYNVLAVWIFGRMLLGSVGFALLALRTFRTALDIGRLVAGPPTSKSPILVAKAPGTVVSPSKAGETVTLVD